MASSKTWIFQCNPERFDIEGYLRQSAGEMSWLVARYKDDIRPGDAAYLWKSGDNAGIVAETEVIGPVEIRSEDNDALPFWLDGEGGEPAQRVRLRVKRVASGRREMIRRDWLKQDHELRDLSIIKMPTGTNFPVAPELAPKLYALWTNIGRDWTYSEVVAALWAYSQIWNQPISKTKGSLVDEVSRLINRVIPGVYNKLMNIRALDPRIDSKGLPSGSKVDKQVWDEFFDLASHTIRTNLLQQRFQELWPSDGSTTQTTLPEDVAVRDAFDAEVVRLEKSLSGQSLENLMLLYEAQVKKPRPRRRSTRTKSFDRNSLVVLITKWRAAFKCEVEDCLVPPFLDADNRPYVETHHLVPLAQGGDDLIQNTACLCPAHHREIHLGKNRASLTLALKAVRAS